MSRLSRLDSSSSSDDGDDALEETLTALHQAHTQYQALHAPRCGVLYLGVSTFIGTKKVGTGGCTMTISPKIQPTGHLASGAGLLIACKFLSTFFIHIPMSMFA